MLGNSDPNPSCAGLAAVILSSNSAVLQRSTTVTLPSFETPWSRDTDLRPRIYILQVRDRHRAERPMVASILVEREETIEHDRDGQLLQAVIRLHFRRLRPSDEMHHFDRRPAFSGCYRPIGPDGPMVALTSGSMTGGAVFLDLPGLEGQHIGTYLMNEIVLWAKQWPEAEVRSVSLLAAQGHNENRERRNRFYEQFGLSFDYVDVERRAGNSRPLRAAALTPTDAWRENLEIVQLDAFLGDLLTEKRRLASDLSARTRAVSELREELQEAARRPLWWIIGQLFRRLRDLVW